MAGTVCGDGLRQLSDRAILLIGFASAMRRSELVALDLSDLEWTAEGVLFHIRRSKTDQEGVGQSVAVPRGSTACPVAALRAWIEAAGIVSGPVFVRIWNKRSQRITDRRLHGRAIASIVKAGAKRLGFDVSAFGAHSLRSGLVTSVICRPSRHKSSWRMPRIKESSHEIDLTSYHAGSGDRCRKSLNGRQRRRQAIPQLRSGQFYRCATPKV
jgi:integrase